MADKTFRCRQTRPGRYQSPPIVCLGEVRRRRFTPVRWEQLCLFCGTVQHDRGLVELPPLSGLNCTIHLVEVETLWVFRTVARTPQSWSRLYRHARGQLERGLRRAQPDSAT